MSLKKSHKILLLFAFLGLLGLIFLPKIVTDAYLWELLKGKPNYQKMKADFELSADELFNEFDADESIATQKFQDKIISVTGTLESVKTVIDGQIQVVMSAENAMFGGIKALMHQDYVNKSGYMEKIKNLKSGMVANLKCKCVGFDLEVDLNNCYILEK